MRCPTCGTENTPDSRFCGGCGAKLVPAEARVAPTAKIPDDAPFSVPGYTPTSVAPSSQPPGPVSYAPPSMPPRVATEARPPARVPEASLSLPAPRSRTWLIATVLAIDLAIAGAGAVLLVKGLAAADPPPAPTTTTTTARPPRTAPPAPAAAPAPKSAAAAAPLDAGLGGALAQIAAEPPAVAVVPTPTKPADAAPPAPRAQPSHVAPKHAAAAAPPAPEDPYDSDHALANEVELAADRARPAFEHCIDAALQAAPVHGVVRVAFEIGTDGHVLHAKAAQNTTGSTALAACLVSAISVWSFATHPAHATAFVRPFSYP